MKLLYKYFWQTLPAGDLFRSPCLSRFLSHHQQCLSSDHPKKTRPAPKDQVLPRSTCSLTTCSPRAGFAMCWHTYNAFWSKPPKTPSIRFKAWRTIFISKVLTCWSCRWPCSKTVYILYSIYLHILEMWSLVSLVICLVCLFYPLSGMPVSIVVDCLVRTGGVMWSAVVSLFFYMSVVCIASWTLPSLVLTWFTHCLSTWCCYP